MVKMLPVFIGLRYAFSHQRQGFISFVNGFALIGMSLGCLALIVVLSVMNGFDQELRHRILSLIPHGYVDPISSETHWRQISEQLESFPGVVGAAPYLSRFVMLSSAQRIQGVQLQGIVPQEERQVSTISSYMKQGGVHDLQPGKFGIILGQWAAQALRVSVGDSITMTLPEVYVTPLGLFPRSKNFVVVGIFEVGAEIDRTLAMMHLEDARRLFRVKNSAQGFRVQTESIHKSKTILHKLKQQLGDSFTVRDWSQTQSGLFQAITMEKRMVTLLLMIIIIVAVLNIVTSLTLAIADKRSDIAVLRTLGMQRRHILITFVTQGVSVGLCGIAIGSIAGCFLAVNISGIMAWIENLFQVSMFDQDVYFIHQLPSSLEWFDVLFVCGSSIVICILATLYPAYCATKIEAAEVLRYE